MTSTPSLSTGNTAPPELWSRYRHNFARHLLALAREYKRAVMNRLQASPDYSMLRLSFESVVTTLYAGPLRPKEIAARLGLSKQHASQLINDVQRAGLVEKRADPDDHRARLIALTALGQRLVVDGLQAAVQVTEQFAAPVGLPVMARTLQQTACLCEGLGLELVAAPGVTAMADSQRYTRGVIGEQMLRLADHVQRHLMNLCRQRGFTDLKLSDGQVLVHMSPDGVRLRQLARCNDVSTQAIGRIVRDLEQRGYVMRQVDRDDGRGKRIWLTERGAALLDAGLAGVADIQRQLVAVLGEEEFCRWAETLQVLNVGMFAELPSTFCATSAGEQREGVLERQTIEQLLWGVAQRLGPAREPFPPPLRAALGEALSDDFERLLQACIRRLGKHD